MKYLRYSVFFRLLCIVIMLCKTVPTNADNSFPACIVSNPCDCGCSKINETWPSNTKTFKGKTYPPVPHSYDGNCCCPPYNKTSGRSNCLLQKSPAGMFNMAYFYVCAEESPESGYFDPKIRYRGQACNIACWTYKGDLSGDGECVMLATPYGLPTVRLCARTAVPADPLNSVPQDEGYTPDMHLDFEGFFVDDYPLSNGGYDATGNPISPPNPLLQTPKVCLYFDPSLVDTLLNLVAIGQLGALVIPILAGLSQTMGNVGGVSPADALLTMINPDLVDINPISEPLHHSSGVSPIFEFIISLLESGADIATALANWLDDLPDYLKYSPHVAIMEGLLKLIDIVSSDVGVPFLKFIGTLNRVVVGSFGCVNIPLGPFPPPYCTPLKMDNSIPVIYPICATTVLNDGQTVLSQQSTNYDPCKQTGATCPPPIPYGLCSYPASGERNNFIHNSIRVGFNDYKPLCTSNKAGDNSDLTVSGQCVNIIGNTSATLMHTSTHYQDTIPLCSDPTGPIGEGTCISSTFLSNECKSASTKPWYCTNGIRVVYSVGRASLPGDYFDESLSDCGIVSNNCQVIWGVNLGSYADLVVAFPAQETTNNTSVQQSSTVTLPDFNNSPHTFYAAIPRVTTQIASGTTSAQEPGQICAYESNSDGSIVTIGCKDRPIPPKPTVYACDGSLCTSTFFYPKMITSLSVPAGNGQNDSTKGVVGPVTDNTIIPSTINLAGFDYEAYGTDNSFAKKPFSGSHAIINNATIYGNYLYDIPPYNAIGQPNSSAIYLNGLEYLNSKYQLGATWLCLSGYKVDDCITGETRQNCVLANLLNNNVISCSTFRSIMAKYNNIDICNPNNSMMRCNSVNPIETYTGYNNNRVKILTCQGLDANGNVNGITSVCYDYGAQNGRLCETSEDAANRIIPSSAYGNTLLKNFVANVDYYDYKPGVSSSPNAQAALTSQTNATLLSAVIKKAQDIYNTPVTTTYSPTTCQSNSAPLVQNPNSDFAQGAISACTTARGSNDQLNSICTATQSLVTDHNSTLYKQLVSACSNAKSSMQPILTDQFNTQLLQQMQLDAISAKNVLSDLIKLINNFVSNPTLISNIISNTQTIYASTDLNTYPTPISKITAICTKNTALFMTTNSQTGAPIVDSTFSPVVYNALNSSCTTAQNTAANAQAAALTTLNTTLQGFTQYSLNPAPTNNGALTSVDGSSTVGYIEPNLDTMVVRNRTDLENGLCIAVPQPKCTAVTAGNATWSAADLGTQSTGTCMPGYTPISDDPAALQRYCTVDKTNKVTMLTPLTSSMGCVLNTPILTSLTLTTDESPNITYNVPLPANLTFQNYRKLTSFDTQPDASNFLANANASNNLDSVGRFKYQFYYIDDVSKYAQYTYGTISSSTHTSAIVIRLTSNSAAIKLTANYTFSSAPTVYSGVAHGYTVSTSSGRISVPYFMMALNNTATPSATSSNTCTNVASKDSWLHPCATDLWITGNQKDYQNARAMMYTGRDDVCGFNTIESIVACIATPDGPIALDIWILLDK